MPMLYVDVECDAGGDVDLDVPGDMTTKFAYVYRWGYSVISGGRCHQGG